MSAKYKSPSFLLPNEINTSTNPSLSADRASMYSMDFDGTEYINAGRLLSSENTSTVSISFWLKIPSTGAKSYLGYWDHPNGWLIEADAYSLYFAIGNTSYNALKLGYSGNISINTWYHIAMVFDGTQTGNANRLKVYLNGTQKTLTTSGSSVIPASIPSIPNAVVTIGGITPSTVNGAKSIDEVAIFNRALNTTEIAALYEGTSPNIYPSNLIASNLNPIAYYPLGEQAQNTGKLPEATANVWQFPNGVLQDYVMDFDGTLPGDAITSNTSGITGNAARTVSFWYNIGISSSAMIPFSLGGIYDTNSNSQFAYCINRQDSPTTAAIFGRGENDISPITVPATNDSQWHNVIITYTGSTLALYIDGSNITLLSQPSAYATTDGFKIGGWSEAENRLFDGKISNVQIFNTALPAAGANSVQTLYNNGSPLTSMSGFTSLTNWWKLNADSVYTPSAPNYTKALKFDGASVNSDYISVPSSLPPSGTSNFALSGWFYRDSNSSTASVYFDKVSGTNFLVREAGLSGTIEIFANGTNYNYSSLSTYNTANAWHHIVISYDGSNLTVYVDTNKLSQSATGLNILSTSDMRIGARAGNQDDSFFKGFISNVAVYNTNLTDSNVSTLFNFGTPETTPSFSPQAWWKLDNTTTGIQDSSGNGNNGTNNGTTQVNSSVAVVPSWKIPTALTIPSINYTSALKLVGGTSSSPGESIAFASTISTTSTTSFSMWLKTTTTSNQYILSNFPSPPNGILFRNGRIYFFDIPAINASGYPQSTDISSTLTDGNWHHLVITRDNKNVKFYLDSNNVSTSTTFNLDFTSFDITHFGKASSNHGIDFNGEVSNLAIFNSVLLQANVETLYNNGQPQDSISFTPTHWWKLNSINGTTVTDTNGSNNGTTSGSIETTDVKTSDLNIPVNGVSTTLPSTALQQSDLQFDSPYSNYSLSFDGSGDYINCGNNVGLSGISSMAFSNWVKYDNPTQANTWRVSMGNSYWNTYGFSTGLARTGIVPSGGVQPFFTLLSSSGTTNKIGGQNSTSNATSLNPLLANTWYHVAGTWDGTTMKLFINGVIYDYKTFSSSWTLDSTTATFFIGSGASGSTPAFPTLGNIDEAALWLNKTLTDAEILQIYNNGKPNDISSLSPTNWWRLGENVYFDNNSFTVPNSITGAPNGTGAGSVTSMLSADAPGTYANGVGTNLDILDRVGDAPLSTANSQSYNIIPSDISPYVPQYVGDQIANNFSMSFDGVDDYFSLNSINLGTTNTISLWYNGETNSYSAVLGNDDAPNDYAVFVTNGTIVSYKVQDASNGVIDWSVTNVNDGNWHHFAFSRTNTTIDFYIDGNLQTVNSNSLANNDTKVDTIGAKTDGTYPFKGKLDEVAFFNKALTAGQIFNDLYQPTATGTNQTADLVNNPNLPTPVAWYRMGD